MAKQCETYLMTRSNPFDSHHSCPRSEFGPEAPQLQGNNQVIQSWLGTDYTVDFMYTIYDRDR